MSGMVIKCATYTCVNIACVGLQEQQGSVGVVFAIPAKRNS